MKHYPTEKAIGRFVQVDGRKLLHFSGTSYLGMSVLPEYCKLICKGIDLYGGCHGSSRHSNVKLGIYSRFEEYFAQKARAEKALVLSSGYMAGLVAVQTAAPTADLIMAAPDTHPAILPIGHSHDSHGSFSTWAKKVLERCSDTKRKEILLLANAVNPLKPEIHDFQWMGKLSSENSYTLIIDDSHAFGVIGNDIFGTYAKWSHLPVRLLVAGSMAKALAVPGGILLGNEDMLNKARHHVIFRSSSPPAPGPLYAFLEGGKLYAEQHARLKRKLNHFYEKLGNPASFHMLPDYPVISFSNKNWIDVFERKGIILSSFPYPTPEDPPVNRLVLSACHTGNDLAYLLENLLQLDNQIESET